MEIEAEILILPFASASGKSLLERLVDEFRGGAWTCFRGAIGFAKYSGNFPALLEAMRDFAEEEGNELVVTFGADVFAGKTRGSDYEAVAGILNALDGCTNASVNLYHERGRTFHPKLYLFSNEPDERALLIVGSSNWSEGGLVNNVEANVVLNYDLSDLEHRASYDELMGHFDDDWRGV